MCLSTAYEQDQSGRVLMENVKAIQLNKDSVTLTDLMEKSVTIAGTLTFVDLVGGVVIIDCHE